MTVVEIFITILFLAVGYFVGSVNPAYFFGRYKGINLREVGTKNLGTVNAYRSLGLKFAIPTAFYDVLKGISVFLIAFFSGVNLFFAQLAGLMTIVGHIFPFYLKFKGGQGVGAAAGLLLFYIFYYFILNFLTKFPYFFFLFYLIIIVAIFAYITRLGDLLGPMVLPLLAYSIWVNFPGDPFNIFFTILLAHISGIGIYNVFNRHLIKIENENFHTHWWRVATRPFALIFVIFYVFLPKLNFLIFLGAIALLFILFDLYRFIHKKADEMIRAKAKALIRDNEIKRFSSMTIFLVALFITLLLFDKMIAITSSVILIFGDSFGKVFGLAFGRHKFHEKSLEGSLAITGCMFIVGYVLYTILPVSFLPFLIIGCASAPIIEFFSMRINDNLTVPLLTGSIMYVLRLFTGSSV
jgi:glycerol-3-phosphate acyltransferase PlsY